MVTDPDLCLTSTGDAIATGTVAARARVEHLMSDASAMAHRHSGRYLALSTSS
ncbi:MAG: hypothetical protein ACRDTA_09890 [Pseudonocardiaceae bacterium]